MSEQETKCGRIKEVDLQGKSIEEWCENYCKERGRCKSDWETWTEFLFDIDYEKYLIVDNRLFEIIEIESLDNSYYTRIDKQNNNTYTFYSTYYNGGTCLTECLEDELKLIL